MTATTREVTADGFLRVDAALTKVCVSTYRRDETGLAGNPADLIGIYRTRASVFDPKTMCATRS